MKNRMISFVSLFSCLTLVMQMIYLPKAQAETLSEFKKRNAGAPIKVVSPEEFEKIKENQKGVISKQTECTTWKQDNGDQYSIDSKQNDPYQREPEQQLNKNVNLGLNANISGNDKDFLIIVAVIGVVVVASLVVYSLGYLYEMSKLGMDCRYWDELGLRYSYLQDINTRQDRKGQLVGLTYSNAAKMPYGLIGLAFEAGYLDIDLTVNGTGLVSRKYEGAYLMLGPKFTFPFAELDGSSMGLELLAGASTNQDMSLLSTLRLSFNFKAAQNFKMGFNLGAGVIKINGWEGYLSDRDQFNFLTGIESSFNF